MYQQLYVPMYNAEAKVDIYQLGIKLRPFSLNFHKRQQNSSF